ncbi:MAG: hypothetical protein JRH15_22720 [Deltaproteobacteria bacterium]|nr:hypothetical protein [Deltaproteobacteria bacterium]
MFKDPQTGMFHLLYKRRAGKRSEIRIKTAEKIEDFYYADAVVLLDREPGTIAAPGMFYANGLYWLLTEGNEKPWAVEAYAGSAPTGPFIENPTGWVLTDDDACPFPFIDNNILYNFICHRDDGTIWKLGLVTSNLSDEK